MGSRSHLTPREYSLQYNDYLRSVVQAIPGGRLSERWAEQHMPAERGRSYWNKLLQRKQAMTTEDIEVLAGWLDMTPLQFIRAVHRYGEEGHAPAAVSGPSNVSRLSDYDVLRDLRSDDEALPEQIAAVEEPSEDQGTLS